MDLLATIAKICHPAEHEQHDHSAFLKHVVEISVQHDSIGQTCEVECADRGKVFGKSLNGARPTKNLGVGCGEKHDIRGLLLDSRASTGRAGGRPAVKTQV